MNIAKNMEAIFIAAVVLAGAASMATAAVPSITVANATTVTTFTTVAKASAPAMQVVTITAKRLSAAEKAALAK